MHLKVARFFRTISKPLLHTAETYRSQVPSYLAYQKAFALPKKNSWGALGFWGITVVGSYYLWLLKESRTFSAPDTDHLIIPSSLLKDAGPGSGDEGRHRPHKKQFRDQTGRIIFGYEKKLPKHKLTNELLYYTLMQAVMTQDEAYIPKVFVVDKKESTGFDKYSLLSESIGENKSLLGLTLLLNEGSSEEPLPIVSGLGCALAFSNMIGSADSYMRNQVIVFEENGLKAYAIDFEFGGSQKHQHIIDLSSDAEDAALSFLKQGALQEFAQQGFFSKNLIAENGDVDVLAAPLPKEMANGIFWYGTKSKQVVLASLKYDIERGAVLSMYQRFIHLSEDDLNHIVTQVPFLTPRQRVEKYQELRTLQEGVRSALCKVDNLHSTSCS